MIHIFIRRAIHCLFLEGYVSNKLPPKNRIYEKNSLCYCSSIVNKVHCLYLIDIKEKSNMKKYLIILISMFFFFLVSAQEKSNLVEIGSFKNKYQNTDTVSIFIRNNFDDKIILQISLEKRIKKRWCEVLNDIFRQSEFATHENVIILNNKDERVEQWIPYSVALGKKRLLGYFRLKFKFCNSLQDIIFTTYSTCFLLK